MGDIKAKYGTQGVQITISLAGLVSGTWRQSTSIDNTTNLYMDALVGGKVTTGTSPTANKTILFYCYATIDGGTLFTAGCSGTDGSYTQGEEDQLFFLGSVITDATSDHQYEYGPFSVRQAFGGLYLPDEWGVVVTHDTAVNLNSTAGNHDMNYQGVFANAA
jgi:hypothetical protein